MALSHLLETSVLTRLGNPVIVQAILELEQDPAPAELGRSPISDLEVGFAARNAGEWDELLADLEAFEFVQTTAVHVRRAKEVQRLLAAKHQRGRKVADLLIAATAEAADLTVVHYDADFDLIASVTGQSCQWVVPRGSID
jgi:predicted nucleic acid-binding protein